MVRHRLLERELVVNAPRERVFEFFSDPSNLECLTPPWLHFRILTGELEMRKGLTIDYRLRVRGVPVAWRSEITAWNPPLSFKDEQVRGPYRLWVHDHTFTPVEGGTRVTDRVRYAVPGWLFEPLVHSLLVGPDLRRIFDYRRDRMVERFGELRSATDRSATERSSSGCRRCRAC